MNCAEYLDSRAADSKWATLTFPSPAGFPKQLWCIGSFVVEQDKILLFGGYKPDTNKCWLLNTETNEIDSAADLPQEDLFYNNVTVLNKDGKIFTFSFKKKMYSYDIAKNEWILEEDYKEDIDI